jgi:Ca2+:H+ antiporter
MQLKRLYSRWPVFLPVLSGAVLGVSAFCSGNGILFILAFALLGSVFSAVHHAEVISERIGEPFSTLVLALAVTIIEVALIVSIMLADPGGEPTLARDTVFAEIMIILNGMIGVSTLIGGLKYREQVFGLQGVSSVLTILLAMSALTLILPNYTETVPGPVYSRSQLILVSIITLFLYVIFVVFQNIKHRAYFLSGKHETIPFSKPGKFAAAASIVLLLVSLTAVILIAKKLSPSLEYLVETAGAPKSLVGVIIACIVLLPEALSAIRATSRNDLQKSLNFSLGSALASIGLTIPAVAIVSIYKGIPLMLGIDIKSTVLFILTLFVIALSLRTGKTNGVEGVVLLIILAVYLFTIVVP